MNTSSATYKPVVVISAYRRADSLRRLLQSVNDAQYPEGGCSLIISLEGGAKEEVITAAEEFNFNHGPKKIVRHSEKLGLKSHIYECAGYSREYGSVVVLEDDLLVSPAYYLYAVRALQAYQNEESVAGISLYAQRFNETAQLPFEPMPSYYAGYFMMLACSWGQAWTAEQWKAYQKWTKENPVPDQIDDVRIPENIRMWPAESWKREFNLYLIHTSRTISYPYFSLTSNSSHYGGENMSGTGGLFEVPVVGTLKGIDRLIFPEYKNSPISYDMYMEAEGSYIEKAIGLKRDQISVDLYGMKPKELLAEKSHFVTSKKVKTPDVRFPLLVKPLEWNLNYPVSSLSETFFSLGSSKHVKTISINRSGYISIAQHSSYNRTDTKKFIIQNLIELLKNKL